ncbi:MAG: Co2+/Mg2+ efflux protein ApaG [Candidatus Hydrogenedentota bacterium]|nr:MAG: Co2+/Mg2+ efflux protein ApaG [Candidatus Hydrogenedentota bacterium]
MPSNGSETVTESIRVIVQSRLVPEQSQPAQNLYFFSYKITITNEGSKSVQLLSRHWIITDGLGNTEEIQGDGVVGEQPRILPGASHSYTSFCPLPTFRGTMEGTYTMQDDSGRVFHINVGRFHLISPESLN